MICVAVLFSAFGVFSLLSQRAYILNTGRETIIEASRFTGQVSGYEYAGFMFLFIPILMLLLSKRRIWRFLGWIAGGGFIISRITQRLVSFCGSINAFSSVNGGYDQTKICLAAMGFYAGTTGFYSSPTITRSYTMEHFKCWAVNLVTLSSQSLQ